MPQTSPYEERKWRNRSSQPGLREISLWGLKSTPDECIIATLENQQLTLEILALVNLGGASRGSRLGLLEVNLDASIAFEDIHLCAFAEKAPSIEALSLLGVLKTNDRVIEKVIKLGWLTQLDISRTQVTDIGVRMLMDECELVEVLAADCRLLSPQVIRDASDHYGEHAFKTI
ncbi:uncharacterized protein BYT42DRAFT_549464 [Radiomyces spectabilis]|uniref:uncharacterized protein n=1 Tax=Radiomyces spectabilis TaxID=64574 RepID=UPI00221EE09E|nr:uncharacterized protein BYT42DRAFT_549464 [Radiomyces spectabilis]KAI8368285.1 hypothetical protein BYT42DRAFT_549464 [Radiomyces spectabilis]